MPEDKVDFLDRDGDPQQFNRYDVTAALYGWSGSLVEDDTDKVNSNCFISLYESVT